MNDETFAIVVRDDGCLVECHGRVAGAHATELRNQVKPLIGKAKKITLDFTAVTYMDSLGLGVIAALYVSARSAGGQLEVLNLSPRIRELFSVSRLLSLFEPAGQSGVRIP